MLQLYIDGIALLSVIQNSLPHDAVLDVLVQRSFMSESYLALRLLEKVLLTHRFRVQVQHCLLYVLIKID